MSGWQERTLFDRELTWLKIVDASKDGVQRRVWFSIEFVPYDCWIGAFWKDHCHAGRCDRNVYICVLPCLPIHLQIVRRIK